MNIDCDSVLAARTRDVKAQLEYLDLLEEKFKRERPRTRRDSSNYLSGIENRRRILEALLRYMKVKKS